MDTVVADLVLGGEVLDDGGDVEVAAVPDHRPTNLHHQVPHTQLPALGIHKLLVMIILTLAVARILNRIGHGIISHWINTSASKSSIRMFVITEKAPTRAFSWLKAVTTAFTFKTLLRHFAKQALTPRSLNMKFGP